MISEIHVVFTDDDTYDVTLDGPVLRSRKDEMIEITTLPGELPSRVLIFPADKVYLVDIEELEEDE